MTDSEILLSRFEMVCDFSGWPPLLLGDLVRYLTDASAPMTPGVAEALSSDRLAAEDDSTVADIIEGWRKLTRPRQAEHDANVARLLGGP